MFQPDSKKGFTLIEVMVVAGIGTILALGISNLIVTSVKASRSARAALEYANLITITKKTLDARTDCSTILGQVQYEGEEVDVPQISVYGDQFSAGEIIPSSGLEIESIVFEDTMTPAIPIDLLVNNAAQNYFKYDTQLIIQAKRSEQNALGGAQMRPVPIPITLYVDQATNDVQFCAGNDETLACAQIGGNYIPAQGNAPPSCDIRPAVGGCLIGGTFSLVNNSCATGNPYTGTCSCRQGFAPVTMVDYKPHKQASLTQRQCLNCAGGAFTPNLNMDPLYDNNQLQQDLLCIQDPQANCPCQLDPNSPQCICFTNPQAPNCDDPCYTEPNGCPCKIQEDGFALAAQDPVCIGFFGGPFGGGFFGGGFIGGINP